MSKRKQETEYEVRSIAVDGDVLDVWHFDTLAEAEREMAADFGGETVALVLEKAVRTFKPNIRNPTIEDSWCDYTMLAVRGDVVALREGNWIDAQGNMTP